MKIHCPAKINLFLEVTGRRRDGYHNLSTLFAKINLYDTLDLTAARDGSIKLSVKSDGGVAPVGAGEDNLVMRAARAFFREFKISRGVRIVLTKRIPIGAGLGGGSSDAAATLLGLAKLFDIKLNAACRARLKRLGASLGADVPFFLDPAPFCVGKGIGDRLRPVPVRTALPHMVLIYPQVHVSTAQSYESLPKPLRSDVLTRLSQLDKLLSVLKKGRPVEEWEGLLFNRLEQAKLPALSRVKQAREVLKRLGALGVRMSGSGSSVFGFVSSRAKGQQCLKKLRGCPWRVFLTGCQG